MDWAEDLLAQCMGCRPGESVLILVDSPLREAGAALSHAARGLGSDRVRLTVVDAPGLIAVDSAPFDIALALFARMDLRQEIPALRAGRAAAGPACRWGIGGAVDLPLLAIAAQADFNRLRRLGEVVRSWFCGEQNAHGPVSATADWVRLTAPGGTDLTFRIGGRPVHVETGCYHKPGDVGNLPGGEVYVAPWEDSAEGVLVVDGALGDLQLDEPVHLNFAGGRVVRVDGGKAANVLRERLGNEPMAWTIGEFGIGIHPDLSPAGPVTVAEKALGTAHIALGANQALGGQNGAATHYDGVVLNAAIVVDGRGTWRLGALC